MKTTLNAIREHAPCAEGWKKLLSHLGKTEADDEPLSLLTILESNGLDDALWSLRAVEGYDREIRLYAVWCARQVEHLLTDQRSRDTLEVAERFARGRGAREELAAAWAAAAAARDAAWSAAGAARDAAWAAAWAAAAAARDAAWSAAVAAAVAAAAAVVADAGAAAAAVVADAAAAAYASYAAATAAGAPYLAARSAQSAEFRRVCEAINAGSDPYPEEAL